MRTALDLSPQRARARRGRIAHREDGEQTALFRWADLNRGRWPELGMLYAVPNGAFLAGDAKRRAIQAARLKRQGLKPGVPDVCLPVPRAGFHGLYVEMKAEGGRVQEEQGEWIAALRTHGYIAEVCVGWKPAAELLTRYLRGEAT